MNTKAKIVAAIHLTTGEELWLEFPAIFPGRICRMIDLASVLAVQIVHDYPDLRVEQIEEAVAYVESEKRNDIVIRSFLPCSQR